MAREELVSSAVSRIDMPWVLYFANMVFTLDHMYVRENRISDLTKICPGKINC